MPAMQNQTLELEVMPAKPDGRATAYYSLEDKAAIKQAIIAGLSEGTPLSVILREWTGTDKTPNYRAIGQWKDSDEAFATDYAHARQAGYDNLAFRTRATARGEGQSTGDVQRDKMMIENDHWLLSKWSKNYADKVTHEVNTKTLILKVDATLTPEDASEAYKELMG